ASWLCDPHFGVGADGVLVLSRSEDPELVAELRIFNPDGSEAELSGNGAREAILYLRRHGWTDAETFSIGNPQCAIVVGDGLEGLDLAAIGPDIEGDEQFPNRTNVSFLRIDDGRVR